MKLCVCCLSKPKQKDEKTRFCQFYEIVCILLVKPCTLEQPKQNYTVVERSTFNKKSLFFHFGQIHKVKIQHCIKCIVFGSSNPELVNQQRPCFFYFFIVYNSVTQAESYKNTKKTLKIRFLMTHTQADFDVFLFSKN